MKQLLNEYYLHIGIVTSAIGAVTFATIALHITL